MGLLTGPDGRGITFVYDMLNRRVTAVNMLQRFSPP